MKGPWIASSVNWIIRPSPIVTIAMLKPPAPRRRKAPTMTKPTMNDTTAPAAAPTSIASHRFVLCPVT